MTLLEPKAPQGGPVCRRCGTCCLQGGPTLMERDVALLTGGVLALEAVVSLRAGEWARDDVRQLLAPLENERIKVAGLGGSAHPWRCRYYADGAGCTVYGQRPAQCAALYCTDTGPLERLLAAEAPLSRAVALQALAAVPVLPGFPDLRASTRAILADMAAVHEEQSPVRPVLELAARLGYLPRGGRGVRVAATPPPLRHADEQRDALAQISEAARIDAAFRELCQERADLPGALLPFLLGRPLTDLLAEVGLRPAEEA